MSSTPNMAAIAGLIADPSRATMLAVLMGGVTLPATDLARLAKVSPQTASSHLSKLVEGGLLTVKSNGRHRYFQLSNSQVAQALEALMLISPAPKVNGLSHSLEMRAVKNARTCYTHLAGELGVAVTGALEARGYITTEGESYDLTSSGEDFFQKLGVDPVGLRRKRQTFAKACLDWSERKSHLAGALGTALTARLLELGWIARIEGSRAVKVTEVGRQHFLEELGLTL